MIDFANKKKTRASARVFFDVYVNSRFKTCESQLSCIRIRMDQERHKDLACSNACQGFSDCLVTC